MVQVIHVPNLNWDAEIEILRNEIYCVDIFLDSLEDVNNKININFMSI